jgi:hypothetical protein
VPSQGGHGELDIAIETFSDCDRGQLSKEKNDDDLGLRNILVNRLQDNEFNRLTAMVAYLRPLFFELRTSLISFQIFVRCQRLIARNVADSFLLFFSCLHVLTKLVASMT